MMLSFQCTLLEHGSFHQMEGVEEYNATIKVSMGYAVTVGMCFSEEMAHTVRATTIVNLRIRSTQQV